MTTLKLIEIGTTIFAILTIALVIMNQPQTGDTFGSKDSFMHTRRGFEQQLHTLTIASSAIMLVLVLASQVLK